MGNKIKSSAFSYEPNQDGTLALYTTENLMIVPQSRYLELLHMEELYNAMHTDLDHKQHSLERERKMLKKQNAQLTEEMQKVKQQNMVLQKKGDGIQLRGRRDEGAPSTKYRAANRIK
ncbi:hypothetical protein U1P98_14575 [Lysinibacillus irui]|uniref:Transposase n=1 Tax=Lysinibacillus irui TaxID=2998077 RepID=A0ABU5NNG1_9BACI|nr:hypothetical protein [Lysinibacillus irui]MEA0552398.1 hypothetical protein [Lysinibacillus irui]MEA0977531.1 hypothetical protein [Lysinibacillus irui]MEA1043685.1 hypothetical protein [Lysinibacillus irui]